MAKKTAAQLDHEIKDALTRCPDCNRPFDPVARRHMLDSDVNRFLIPGCCAVDYRAANPAWKPTRPVHAIKKGATGEDLSVGQRFDHLGHIYEITKIGRDKLRTVQIARRVSDPFGKETLIDHRSFPTRDFDRQHLKPIDGRTV